MKFNRNKKKISRQKNSPIFFPRSTRGGQILRIFQFISVPDRIEALSKKMKRLNHQNIKTGNEKNLNSFHNEIF